MKNYFSHIIYLLVFVSCPVLGQVSKNSNEKLVNDKVNNKGIVTFFINHLNTDMLYLYDFKSGNKMEFENMESTTVLTDDWFFGVDIKTNELIVVDLQKFSMQRLPGIGIIEWIETSNRLLGFDKKLKVFTVFNPEKGIEKILNGVIDYSVCYNKQQLQAVTTSGNVFLYNIKDGKYSDNYLPFIAGTQIKKILSDSQKCGFYIFGNDKNNIFVFKTDNNKSVLKYKGKLKQNGREVDTLFKSVRLLQQDKLVLGMRKETRESKGNVEVWGEENTLEPFHQREESEAIGMIDLHKGNMEVILCSPGEQPIITDNAELYALKWVDDLKSYIPDLKIQRYDTQSKKFQYVAMATGNHQMIYSAPGFSSLFYLDGHNWTRFDPKKKTHSVVTKNMYNEFAKNNNDFVPREHTVIQKPVLLDEKYVLLKDSRDLWLYDMVKDLSNRITSGREKDRIYDFSSVNYSSRKESFSFTYTRNLLPYGNYILHWKDTHYGEEGLSLLDADYKQKHLIQSSHSYSQLVRSKSQLTYVKENGLFPPALYIYDLKTKKETMLYQSNLHDSLATDQRIEYFSWEDKKGNRTGAIVRYPIGYDPNIKYPAIFDIYEKKKQNRLKYQSPYELSMTGFNYRNYTKRGYFVIEPDIHYKYGDPGYSATESVLTAIDKVSDSVQIDKQRLGLIGHSFGGYETNFILTQTNIFKAAVSGSGIFDIVNWYHSVNWTSGRPEVWRYYYESYRMGAAFSEIPDKYYANSPLTYVDRITTPVLIWTGKDDYHVNWNQSVSMYVALKERKKKVKLLIYPKEGHVLENDLNKNDLSISIKNWFDSYLKN